MATPVGFEATLFPAEKIASTVARLTTALHNVWGSGHVADAAARGLHARLERQLRAALDATLAHIQGHTQQQATVLLKDLDILSSHMHRLSTSGERIEHDAMVNDILDEIQSRLASIESGGAGMAFHPDPALLQYIQTCRSIGQLGSHTHETPPCDGVTRRHGCGDVTRQHDCDDVIGSHDRCDVISKRKGANKGNDRIDSQASLNNLHCPFTRYDHQTCSMLVDRKKSVQEHSWNISLVSLAASSETNNSRCNLSLSGELHTDVISVTHEETTRNCTWPAFVTGPMKTPDTVINNNGRTVPQSTDYEFELTDKFESCRHRTSCVIPDIAIMPDMSVVVLDHYHNSIQLFAPDLTFLVEESCEYPMSVCAINANTVAVSLRRNGELVLFRVQDATLKVVRKIKVPCKYYLWQVAYKAGRLFVVCDENNIHVLDTNGTEYFSVCSGVPVERGFIRNFDVSDDGGRLYLCEKRGLRCVTMAGESKWLFSVADFPAENRDTHGHVIEDVCYFRDSLLGTQWISSNVFQVSLDGHFLRNVETSGLVHPRAMAVMGDRLMVTQFYPSMSASHKRQVKVFAIRDNIENYT